MLKAGQQKITEDQRKTVWEHGRRKIELRAKGLLSIVYPVQMTSMLKESGISVLAKQN